MAAVVVAAVGQVNMTFQGEARKRVRCYQGHVIDFLLDDFEQISNIYVEFPLYNIYDKYNKNFPLDELNVQKGDLGYKTTYGVNVNVKG